MKMKVYEETEVNPLDMSILIAIYKERTLFIVFEIYCAHQLKRNLA